ncbi:MAG: FAD-linked oxidase C-terminal domain-containing protein [Microscillaceae bacterium]|nr:FAD-linked oxidase C-terminal domain-containing protein [Microscillaceae bacterium]
MLKLTENKLSSHFSRLAAQFKGEFYHDDLMRKLYATDASAYREMPLAVALPRNDADIQLLIHFAKKNRVSLIPRAAGTSLAGQVVGKGIVVDISKYFNQILEVNAAERWVRLQPGIIRDDLNAYLKEYGLFFGPETSTANRAMVGGMVGNNSCGSNSMVYGSTREHLLEVKGFLSDGSEVEFKSLSLAEFEQKLQGDLLENRIYQKVHQILSDPTNQEEIRTQFPKPSIPRRNTGYALDMLLDTAPFTASKEDFNFCKLIAGSEGTLCFITELKLKLVPLPPKEIGLFCVHFQSVDEALRANLIALKYQPSASELMDHFVLECTKSNIEQRQNRFFVQGDPGAILVIEFCKDTLEEVRTLAQSLQADLEAAGLGYHFPLVEGSDTKKVWTLRKAGLGLLANIPGDAKAVPVIEDTAVDVQDLPEYIREFNLILDKYGMSCVHYAHAGSGELHLRPIINLKTEEGNRQFRTIAEEIALLVKKYKGSLSGEHGDGRLRGEFIQWMIGDRNYELLREVKFAFDPENIFNPHKIVQTPPMNESLRYRPGQKTPELKTVFDFSNYQGIIRSAEMCNGSGDCRKTEISGGTMCPSYMATRLEKHTTRARANILREVLTNSTQKNPFDSEEIKDVMDLCLSCKGCKSECPSNVDIGKMKAEFLQQYYQSKGVPFRTRLIAEFSSLNRLASLVPWAYNGFFNLPLLGKLAKKMMGFAPERSMPPLHNTTLKKWFRNQFKPSQTPFTRKVYLFADEFTHYNDVQVGITTVKLLNALGYEVIIPTHEESGRTYLSKGLLKKAQKLARKNVNLLKGLISPEAPLIGIEPSAILTFRDEYLDLLSGEDKIAAQKIALCAFTIEEFLAQEMDKGYIRPEMFTTDQKLIKYHGHCHQKALSSLTPSKKILTLPTNYEMHLIPSGCCGMAGSFGYEKEHYELSQQIGELVLFPTVRKQGEEVIIAAPGTSCRHQIKDGTGRIALHPVEILWEALVKK